MWKIKTIHMSAFPLLVKLFSVRVQKHNDLFSQLLFFDLLGFIQCIRVCSGYVQECLAKIRLFYWKSIMKLWNAQNCSSHTEGRRIVRQWYLIVVSSQLKKNEDAYEKVNIAHYFKKLWVSCRWRKQITLFNESWGCMPNHYDIWYDIQVSLYVCTVSRVN